MNTYIVFIVLGLTLPSMAGIKAKDVVGTWSYQIDTGYETLSGKLVFEKDGKGLSLPKAQPPCHL